MKTRSLSLRFWSCQRIFPDHQARETGSFSRFRTHFTLYFLLSGGITTPSISFQSTTFPAPRVSMAAEVCPSCPWIQGCVQYLERRQKTQEDQWNGLKSAFLGSNCRSGNTAVTHSCGNCTTQHDTVASFSCC